MSATTRALKTVFIKYNVGLVADCQLCLHFWFPWRRREQPVNHISMLTGWRCYGKSGEFTGGAWLRAVMESARIKTFNAFMWLIYGQMNVTHSLPYNTSVVESTSHFLLCILYLVWMSGAQWGFAMKECLLISHQNNVHITNTICALKCCCLNQHLHLLIGSANCTKTCWCQRTLMCK